MSTVVNFVWPQGEDLVIELVYKEGSGKGVAVNLAGGYEARMDLYVPGAGTVLHTLESGAEISLTQGLSASPNITITLPRNLLLPGGPVISALPASSTIGYDLFLRNLGTDKQIKVVRGTFTIERSGTLWP